MHFHRSVLDLKTHCALRTSPPHVCKRLLTLPVTLTMCCVSVDWMLCGGGDQWVNWSHLNWHKHSRILCKRAPSDTQNKHINLHRRAARVCVCVACTAFCQSVIHQIGIWLAGIEFPFTKPSYPGHVCANMSIACAWLYWWMRFTLMIMGKYEYLFVVNGW